MNGLVSVVIPAYNREATILDSVNSVLRQSYKNIEVIIVDDCSTDGTVLRLSELVDKRVKVVRLEKNSGACAARNKGIKESRGSFIAFNDSDDIWHNNKLERQLEELEATKADIAFCQIERHGYGRQNGLYPNLPTGLVPPLTMMVQSKCSTQTIIAKKEVFDRVTFDETMPRLQDYDFVLSCVDRYRFCFLQECLVDVYLQDNSITTTDLAKRLDVYKKLLNKHAELCNKYPELEFYLLSTVFYSQVLLEVGSEDTYERLRELNKLVKSYQFEIKALLYRTGLLRPLWRIRSKHN